MIIPTDYRIVVDWWEKHGFPVLPQMMLPSTGFMYYKEAKPICSVYVYLPKTGDGGCLAVCEYWVANPDATREERDEGFPQLLKFVKLFARENGILALTTSIKNQSLLKRLEGAGWQQADTGMISMIQDTTKD